eukprot:155340-Chlamydomonas_euryale.AAC.1
MAACSSRSAAEREQHSQAYKLAHQHAHQQRRLACVHTAHDPHPLAGAASNKKNSGEPGTALLSAPPPAFPLSATRCYRNAGP